MTASFVRRKKLEAEKRAPVIAESNVYAKYGRRDKRDRLFTLPDVVNGRRTFVEQTPTSRSFVFSRFRVAPAVSINRRRSTNAPWSADIKPRRSSFWRTARRARLSIDEILECHAGGLIVETYRTNRVITAPNDTGALNSMAKGHRLGRRT